MWRDSPGLWGPLNVITGVPTWGRLETLQARQWHEDVSRQEWWSRSQGGSQRLECGETRSSVFLGASREEQPCPQLDSRTNVCCFKPGEENGNSLQYSCPGNSMDRGAGRLQSVGPQRVNMTKLLSMHTEVLRFELQHICGEKGHNSTYSISSKWKKMYIF